MSWGCGQTARVGSTMVIKEESICKRLPIAFTANGILSCVPTRAPRVLRILVKWSRQIRTWES